MSHSETVKYGLYTIKARIVGGKAIATGYLHDKRKIEAEGESLQDAIELLKTRIDALLRKRPTEYHGTLEDYVQAFGSVIPTESERLMLHAHLNAKDHTMTATELAQAAGYKDYEVANSIYGKLAKKIGDVVGLMPRQIGDEVIYTFIIAEEGKKEGGPQHWRWVMHPEVVQALKSLNFRSTLSLRS
jgi:hypothetical protein